MKLARVKTVNYLVIPVILTFSSILWADIKIYSAQRLNASEELLNSRYLLICQNESGIIEDTDTGKQLGINNRDLCERIKVMSRLADNQCSITLNSTQDEVLSIEQECSIEKMLNH